MYKLVPSSHFTISIRIIIPSVKHTGDPGPSGYIQFVITGSVSGVSGVSSKRMSAGIRTHHQRLLEMCFRWNREFCWLVGNLPLWKIWTSVGMIIPNIWENKKCSKPPTRLCLLVSFNAFHTTSSCPIICQMRDGHSNYKNSPSNCCLSLCLKYQLKDVASLVTCLLT